MSPNEKTHVEQPGSSAQTHGTGGPKPPTNVPGYEPIRFLGTGAYGEVWVALDKNTGRHVAIKFFEHRGGVDWSLLSREVEKLAFLSADRYVVQLLDVGWNADPPYYVMEYVENGSLDDHLRLNGSMDVPQAVEVFREIAVGLSHAHAKGVLHCDIKPANILLDQDQKPRLADFGQSRLTTEQNPALGTLFYMAPEQADLEAVPDAKWDVYALGAVLYCMLTGQPPYRDATALDSIDSARDLPERLKKYRDLIRSSPAPVAHRKVRGVDRQLADIVNRCLAVNPEARYPHVVGVLEDLKKREAQQVRRPVQLLGILLPLLLLLTIGVFGYRAYERAIKNSEREYVQRSHEANRFAAEGAARNVANELDKRFRAIEAAALSDELVGHVDKLLSDGTCQSLLRRLSPSEQSSSEESLANRSDAKSRFREAEKRQSLQGYLGTLLTDPRGVEVASWFVTDSQGTMLAAEFDHPPRDNVIGDNFAYRTYFHGGARDFDSAKPHDDASEPLADTHLSAPFRSTATQTYKVAISTPIRDSASLTIGVVVMTFELGHFVQFQTSDDLCAVLVDSRPSDFSGMILQHPLLDELVADQGKLPDELDIRDSKYRTSPIADENWANKLRTEEYYEDPLSKNELGKDYAGDWIMAAAPVSFNRTQGETPQVYDTGLLLLVQRRLSSATQPVRTLAALLFREAIAAIVVVSLLSVALWYFVRRMMGHNVSALPTVAVGSGGSIPAPVSVHSRETLEMPEKADTSTRAT